MRFLTDTAFTGGMAPKLGDQHLRTISVLGMPGTTTPGLLDELNDLAIPYSWVTRWICLGSARGAKIADPQTPAMVRQTQIGDRHLARSPVQSGNGTLLDTDASTKAAETNEALEDLGSGDVAFGYVTTTITVSAEDETKADEALRQVERVVNARGFVTIRESFNAVEAWLGSLPGNVYANVRQPIIHTLNLAHIMPISSVWAGPNWNDHLDQPPLDLYGNEGIDTLPAQSACG